MNGDIKPSKKPHQLGKKVSKVSSKKKYESQMELGRNFSRVARAPLKKQDTSDAWNERQNRLAAARDAVKIKMKATMERNRKKK